jgi:hypothetical protein
VGILYIRVPNSILVLTLFLLLLPKELESIE